MVRTRPPSGRVSALALAVCAGSLTAWSALGLSGWPASGLEAIHGDRLLWLDPAFPPIAVAGDLDTADVIVAGDSRAAHAVHLSITDSLGLGEFAIVWLASARLQDLLAPLRVLPSPCDLVVALTPVGLIHLQRDLAIGETLRVANPAADPASPPRLAEAWARGELQHLLDKGFDRGHAERTIAWWMTNYHLRHRKWLARDELIDTHGIDLWLGHRVDRARAITFDPVEPKNWHTAWRNRVNPRASDRNYRLVAAPERADERARGATELAGMLSELETLGWRIACVRLPIDPELRRIEDESGCIELFEGITRHGALPFRDFGGWDDATFDGSHLHWRAADRLTRELGRWLREDLHWSRAR